MADFTGRKQRTYEHLLVAGDGLAVSDEEGIIRLRGIDKLSNIIIFNLRA